MWRPILSCHMLELNAETIESGPEMWQKESGHSEAAFTTREWSQIQELVHILEPFAKVTNLTQG